MGQNNVKCQCKIDGWPEARHHLFKRTWGCILSAFSMFMPSVTSNWFTSVSENWGEYVEK